MSAPRFTELTPETMTAEQRRVAEAIQSGPRGAGLRGPFNALLRAPDLADLVQRVGAYVRYSSSLPAALYDFATSLVGTGAVSDAHYEAVMSRWGERGVMDLTGAIGYYSLVSMVLNVACVPLPPGEA